MKIGVIGHGFVGTALTDGFAKKGIEEVGVHDIKYPESSLDNVLDAEVVFVCLPTPVGTLGQCDSTIIDDTLRDLEQMKYSGVVAIKSTVAPMQLRKLAQTYTRLQIVANPEFLVERWALDCFLHPSHIVIGGETKPRSVVANLYAALWKKTPIFLTTLEGAMMAKYMTNIYLATKVALMNEFYEIAETGNYGDWDEIVKAFLGDTRIHKSHTSVPGPDGKFGFGGHCFPKDIFAMMAEAASLLVPGEVISAVADSNERMRAKPNS